MTRPPELLRFTPAERWVHRMTSLLIGLLVLTAAALYFPRLSVLVGHRPMVEAVHVAAGFLLPAPSLLGLLSPEFRADLRRLNRFRPDDWDWLRRRDRRTAGLPVGKFNGGQKLAAAFVAGAGLVLLGTGVVMLSTAWADVPLGWRQGATLVHDLLSLALVMLLAGHVWMAYRHPEARLAMRTGLVPAAYGERQHPAWVQELRGSDGQGQPGL